VARTFTARAELIGELDQFVTARLALVLLPVRDRLLRDGRMAMADAVRCAAGDIAANLELIVDRYEIEHHTKR
jgi:hypothetical protein